MDENKIVKPQKKLQYTQSAVEYLGLVSWSFIIKCNDAVQKTGNAMIEGILAPFSVFKKKRPNKKTKPFKSVKHIKESEQKILKLESSIAELEKRLTLLEKSGVTIPVTPVQKPKEKKELRQESRAMLKMLVDDNKLLKNMIKSQNIKKE